MILLLLIVLLVFGWGGYYGYNRQYYGARGLSLIGVLLIVIIAAAFFGAPRMGYGAW